jgi:hypothetical protein
MIGQRDKPAGKGLPRTACAPDLFTRIDALAGNQTDHATWPVRWYIGFGTPLPNFQMLRGDGMVWQIVVAFGGKPQDGAILRRGKDLATGVLLIVIWIMAFLSDVMTTAKLGLGGKNDPAVREISADIAAKELTARLTGSDPTWATAIDVGARNYLSPQQTVDAAGAVSAYLANTIDQQAVHDYSRYAGVCDVATGISIDVGQARPAGGQLLDLYYRGVIDRKTADDQYRQLGYLKSQYVEWEHELHKWWPDQGTVVTWMRLGTTHEQPAKGLDLDRDFDASYGDDQKRWGRALGLTDEQVRWLWRSQFQPLDTQTAGDWFRRNVAGWWQGEAEFTEDDLDQAIKLSTLPPAYRDLAKQAIWQPISSRLLRMAYDESVVDDDQVKTALVIDGYRPDDAETILQEWRRLKPAYVARKIGAPGVAKLQGLYADGTIGLAEFEAGCVTYGLDDSEQSQAVAAAVQARTWQHRGEVIAKLKTQYLSGAVADSTIPSVLNAVGLSASDSQDLGKLWRTEFEISPRADSSAQLIGYYKQGFIDESDLVSSLTQLRYTPAQIARMIGAADLAGMTAALQSAEKLVGGAKTRLAADQKLWAAKIAQAEKLVGGVGQRIVTRAGKQMSWIKTYVTGTPVPVAKKGPATNGTAVLREAASEAAAKFVTTGVPGVVVPGPGIELSAPTPPATAAPVPPEPAQPGGTGDEGLGFDQ